MKKVPRLHHESQEHVSKTKQSNQLNSIGLRSNSRAHDLNDSDLLLNSINYNGFDEAQRILQSDNHDDIIMSIGPSKSLTHGRETSGSKVKEPAANFNLLEKGAESPSLEDQFMQRDTAEFNPDLLYNPQGSKTKDKQKNFGFRDTDGRDNHFN